jgi:hypothetical protein
MTRKGGSKNVVRCIGYRWKCNGLRACKLGSRSRGVTHGDCVLMASHARHPFNMTVFYLPHSDQLVPSSSHNPLAIFAAGDA